MSNAGDIDKIAAAPEITLKKFDAARFFLISVSVAFLLVMLALPLFTVIYVSFRHGWYVYKKAVTDFYTLKAFHLTVLSTLAAVAVNTFFGIFAAWLITKFSFRGKKVLVTAIDIPFAISPVIAGLIFIFMFGRIGWAYPLLSKFNIDIVFAVPGIILAVIFVTIPFVARELIPVLNSQGKDEEEAAALMGAGGFTIFRRITLPNIKWALMYGVILCTARAMGEFGAVSVLSGHLRGKTNTLPLHVEILYNEYKYTESFAVSSILVLLAIIILIARNIVEHKGRKGGEA
jgi:sulfate transport system permease protein